jgi:hypothetical protein
MSYQYLLAPRGDGFAIVHVESSAHLGYIDPYGAKYRVQNDGWDEVAIVDSTDEAISALLTYYETHLPQWKRTSAITYTLLTPFGLFQIEQDPSGQWLAYRFHLDYHCPLLREGKPAVFATAEEAQSVAYAHVCDDYPNTEATSDGLSWHIPSLRHKPGFCRYQG